MSLKSNVVGKMTRVMQGQNVNVVSRLVPQPTLAFSVHLTEHCNLNCKACAHFAPLVKNEGFTDIGEFTKDMERLSELSHGEMRYIDLLGGEPLLHPDIAAFLTVTRKCFPVGAVRLITNGLLLKKMKQDFWDAVAENRITIVISKYLETVDYDELIALIREKARGGVRSLLYRLYEGRFLVTGLGYERTEQSCYKLSDLSDGEQLSFPKQWENVYLCEAGEYSLL